MLLHCFLYILSGAEIFPLPTALLLQLLHRLFLTLFSFLWSLLPSFLSILFLFHLRKKKKQGIHDSPSFNVYMQDVPRDEDDGNALLLQLVQHHGHRRHHHHLHHLPFSSSLCILQLTPSAFFLLSSSQCIPLLLFWYYYFSLNFFLWPSSSLYSFSIFFVLVLLVG